MYAQTRTCITHRLQFCVLQNKPWLWPSPRLARTDAKEDSTPKIESFVGSYSYIYIYGHAPPHDLPRPLFHCKYRQNAYFPWMIISPYFSWLMEVMSLYNVVPTHVRFSMNMPVLTSKKHFKRPHVTTGKPKTKNPKIQNLSAGPETFGFLDFSRVFLFSNRNPKIHMNFFGF